MKVRVIYFIITGIFFFSFKGFIKSQNYKVGIPINKLLGYYVVKSGSECFSAPNEKVSLPYSTVTGITTILIFDSISPPNSIYVNPGHKIINTGDTLFITATSYQYDFYIPKKGKVKGRIYSIGTPTIAGEKYNCGDLKVRATLKLCNTSVSYRYKDENCIGVVEK